MSFKENVLKEPQLYQEKFIVGKFSSGPKRPILLKGNAP